MDVASDAKDKMLATGAGRVGAAKHLGSNTLDRATSVPGKLFSGIAQRTRRRRTKNEESVEED